MDNEFGPGATAREFVSGAAPPLAVLLTIFENVKIVPAPLVSPPPRFSINRIRWPVGLTRVKARSEIRGCWTTNPTFTDEMVLVLSTKTVGLLLTASSARAV